MGDIFIHFGLMKTATKFLQKEIFPKIKNVNLVRNPEFDMKLYDDKINIISDEDLSGIACLPSQNANIRFTIADRLHGAFPKAKAIIGIRDKKSWVRSVYSEYLRNGGIYDYEKFYDELFDKNFLNFEEYIEYLNGLFDDVYVYKFEDLKKDDEKFVNEICNFIGVKAPPFVNVHRRVGYSDFQVKIMLFLNRLFKTDLNDKGGIFKRRKNFNPEVILNWLQYWRWNGNREAKRKIGW
jgi:hypothetical protein